MTCDYDVLMDLPLHHFFTMQIRIAEIQRQVRKLIEDMKEWGFDSKNPLLSDSFTIPTLIQFDADLDYIYEEMANIEKKRKVKECPKKDRLIRS